MSTTPPTISLRTPLPRSCSILHGRLVRALSALGLDGGDLRLALVDAGHGRIGSLGDHLRLFVLRLRPRSRHLHGADHFPSSRQLPAAR